MIPGAVDEPGFDKSSLSVSILRVVYIELYYPSERARYIRYKQNNGFILAENIRKRFIFPNIRRSNRSSIQEF